MRVKLQIVLTPLFLIGSALAQGNAAGEIRDVAVERSSNGTQVQVSLSVPRQPKVIVATNPPRLVLEFTGTSAGDKQRHISVGQDGIKSIRIGLHSANPPIARVVVDLESARPYGLVTDGNRVVLTVLPAIAASGSRGGSGAPGAAGVPLFGRLHAHKHATPSVADTLIPPAPPPAPPSGPRITLPETAARSASNATQSAAPVAPPSAAHPNLGGLQEGTVFRSMGAPGTGAVPPAVNSGFSPTQPADRKPASVAAAASQNPVPAGSAPASPGARENMAAPVPAEAAAKPAPAVATSVALVPNSAAAQPAPTTAQKAPLPAPANEPEPPTPILATRQPNADLRTSFKIKYVAEGAAYLDAGRSSGLSEGMKLQILQTASSAAQTESNDTTGMQVVAQLRIISVADTSAVAEISEPTREIKPGDLAYLSSEDTEALVAQRSLSATRKYPTVISFTEGDPLEDEAREEVPKPPLPEVNRARGRIGFDYSGILSHGQFASTSSNVGMVIRTDMTRIGGSYWNLSGYWRGSFMTNSAATQPTLQDLINRTYTIGLTYDNPKSPWVAGVGRLYLPWATSLDTIDGGYVGRHVGDVATVGLFAGSTPDPTSWSYAPDQQMSGFFVNFQGGSFDNFRYTSTSGAGLEMLKWQINRPFVFFENGLYYKRYFSLYSAVQADKPAGNPAVPSPGAGISRSFTTLRIQPWERLEFDVNHTYFRDVPNFDPQLIGTGLLDKYLFQGFSAGPRIEVLKQVWVYATLGKSSGTGESKSSLNQLYGVTLGNLPWRFQADVRYSRFNSSFGTGDYKAFSISRNFHENFRWEILAGQQSYSSLLASSNASKFVNANIEAPLGPHYFVQGGWTVNRGGTLNYDQWFTTFGYRFDSWHRRAK